MSESLADIMGSGPESLDNILGTTNEPLDSILKDTPPSAGEVASSILPVGGALIQQSVGGAFRQAEREGAELRSQIDLQGIGAFDPLDPTHKRLLATPEGASEQLGKDIAAKARQRQQEETPQNMTFWQKAAFTAGTSMVQAATLAPAIAIRDPKLAASAAAFSFGEMAFNREYDEGLSRGLSPEDAMRRGVMNGYVLEGLTELGPAKALLANTGLFNKFVNFMVAELPGESIAEVGQMFTDYLYGLRGEPTVQDIGETLLDVGAAVLLGGAAQTGLATGAQKLLGPEKYDTKIEPEPEEELTATDKEETLDEILEQPTTEGIEVEEPAIEESEITAPGIENFATEADTLVGERPAEDLPAEAYVQAHKDRAARIDAELTARGAQHADAAETTEDAFEYGFGGGFDRQTVLAPIITGPEEQYGESLRDVEITHSRNKAQVGQPYNSVDVKPGQIVESWKGTRTEEERRVGRTVFNMLSRWQRAFIPKSRMVIIDEKAARLTTENKAWHTIDPVTDTSYISYNLPKFQIAGTDWQPNLFEALAHEFGHGLVGQAYIQESREVRRALLNAHQAYLDRALVGTAREWLNEFMSPALVRVWEENLGEQLDQVTAVDLMEALAARGDRPNGKHPANYFFSFDEFMAQQFARYATTKEAPFGMAEGFWKKIYAKLRHFFNKEVGKYVPNTTAELWFESLATRAYLETQQGQERSTTAVTKTTQRKETFNNFLQKVARRYEMEGQGQAILEEMQDNGTTVPSVSAAFWDTTYPQLNDKWKNKFERYLENIMGMRPGDVIAVHPGGRQELAVDWQHIARVWADDAPNNAGALESTERGYVALMQWAVSQSATYNNIAQLDKTSEAVASDRIDGTVQAMAMDLPEEHNQAKMNKFIKNMFNLTQVAGENAHIPGVTDYTEFVRNWWADKSNWTQTANERLGKWKLSKDDTKKFNEAIFAITLRSDKLRRKLTPEEKKEEFLNAELDSPAAMDLFEELGNDFEAAVTELFAVLRADAQKRFSNNAAALQELETRYAKEEAQLKNRNYFPLTRFGKYWTRVRAARPVKYRGVRFKVNETIAYEMFETEREMERRKAQLEKQFPGHLVGGSRLSDIARPFFGMPTQLVEHFLERIDTFGEFSENQKDEIRNELGMLAHETSPSQSYKKHLLHRKGIAGFSFDARRVYANYFMHFANHISRSKYAYPLSQARGRVSDHAKRMEDASIPGRTAVPERLLSDYIEEHYDYVMNPGNELANLRSMGFLWYLGFLPKSALINLTQIPMVALPYLSQKYGDTKTVAELTRAGKDIPKLFRSAKGKQSKLADWEDKLISMGVRAGFLDESLATDLAAVSEGSNLIRAAPGTLLRSEKAAAGVRMFAGWGAYLFQKAEKLNRLQTFMATTRLEMKKGLGGRRFENLTEDQQKELARSAYVAGRDAIEQTMFEYARWNRPKFMRGKKSVVFLFQNFVQNMAYFAGRGPARTRFLLGMLLLAGIQGLPGADDALDLIDWSATWIKQLLGMKNPKTDLRLWMREALEPLGDPDYFMHGISHNSFGMPAILDLMGIPFPSFDLSGSMSLGRIVPGLEPTLDFASPGGEFKRAFPDIVEDAGGAFVAIPMGIMEAISDDNPNTFKRIERMLPSALRNVTKAFGYATEGALRHDRSLLVPYDVSDPGHLAEIIGQSLGFMPTQLSKKKALEWAQNEHGRYYEARKRIIIAQFDEAIRTGDREARQDMVAAIKAYNDQVPDRALKIGGKDLRQSVKQRARNRALREKGLPTNRRNTRYYKSIEERFVDSTEEN